MGIQVKWEYTNMTFQFGTVKNWMEASTKSSGKRQTNTEHTVITMQFTHFMICTSF